MTLPLKSADELGQELKAGPWVTAIGISGLVCPMCSSVVPLSKGHPTRKEQHIGWHVNERALFIEAVYRPPCPCQAVYE